MSAQNPSTPIPAHDQDRSRPTGLAGTAVWLALLLGPQLAACAWPEAAALLEYDRSAIAAGELWRLVTGHLVHWSLRHWALDASALAALAVVMARARLPGLGTIVVTAMLAISACLWFVRPDVEVYRGLSGIDSALFVGVAVGLAARLQGAGRAVAWGCLALFGAKLLYEGATGLAIFLQSSDVMYEAHLVGALVGAALVGLSLVSRPLCHASSGTELGSQTSKVPPEAEACSTRRRSLSCARSRMRAPTRAST
jgi:rhomboid family GlyGly-CTERM serine protease